MVDGLKRYAATVALVSIIAIGLVLMPIILVFSKLGIEVPYQKAIRSVRERLEEESSSTE